MLRTYVLHMVNIGSTNTKVLSNHIRTSGCSTSYCTYLNQIIYKGLGLLDETNSINYITTTLIFKN